MDRPDAPPSTPRAETRSRWVAPGLTLGVGLLTLAAHAWRYWPYISDDAFISLRYSERLLAGDGLTWTDGERVEGYSNLLWVLATALLGALGLDLTLAARLLGALGTCATLAAVVHIWADGTSRKVLPGLVATLALGLSSPMAVWSIGGLEQPLLVALLAAAIALLVPRLSGPLPSPRDMLPAGACLAGVCLTRPDSPLIVGLVGLGWWLARGLSRAAFPLLVWLGSLSVVAVVAQLAFRLVYYRDYVPNTAHAKVAWTLERFQSGMAYVGPWVLASAPLVALALVGVASAWRDRSARARVALVLPALLAWMIYLMGVGGDIFPAWRQLLPATLLLSLLSAEGVYALLGWLRPPAVLAVCTAAISLFGALQLRHEESRRALTERWEFDGLALGTFLREAFGEEEPLLAAQAAGALVYASGLPSHDILGLNDRYLATHPPKSLGKGFMGHELGDGAYTLGLEPDLISFCTPGARKKDFCFRAGREISEDPRFEQGYVRVFFDASTDERPLRAPLWVRRESARIGAQIERREVTVPGWLFGSGDGAFAAFDDEGRLGVNIANDGTASLTGLPISPGAWRLESEGSGAPTLLSAGPEDVASVKPDGTLVVQPGRAKRGEPMTLRLTTERGRAHVRALVFTRTRQ